MAIIDTCGGFCAAILGAGGSDADDVIVEMRSRSMSV
jgi:hypothetical protein